MDKILLIASIAAVAAILLMFAWSSIYKYFDEAARMNMIDEFREHAIYKKFKSVYPNSTETAYLYINTILHVEQSDIYGNKILLSISKTSYTYPYHFFYAICTNNNGAMLEEVFDFLDDNDCLQDPEHGRLSSDPGIWPF